MNPSTGESRNNDTHQIHRSYASDPNLSELAHHHSIQTKARPLSEDSMQEHYDLQRDTTKPAAATVELTLSKENNHVEDDDTVTGNWSLESDDEHVPKRRRRRRQSLQSSTHSNNSTQIMSREDIEICQQLDKEYEQALEEREIGYTARYNSVRQSAGFSVVFMLIYLTLGTVFFMRQANWDVRDSLLFSIYT